MLGKALLWFFGISILLVVLFKWVPVPFTPLMITRAIEHKLDGKEMTCSHDWEPLENISVNLQKAVIASEDGTFLKHNGFDFKAMQKAFKNNNKGRKLKGGSTISQQTAKNVFLTQPSGSPHISKPPFCFSSFAGLGNFPSTANREGSCKYFWHSSH